MADIQELIKTILSDTKLADGGRVYRDEPILRTAAQMANATPPEYREMRRIAKGDGAYRGSNARIFYEQGRFMEDHEDDFDYQGEFVRYFPTYQVMTDAQLRGYFSWRTKVRRGTVEKTSLSFAFVYIYELLNGIGVSSPEDGLHTLKKFRETYGKIDSQIIRYLDIWLKDYVVYNNLDKSLLDGFSDEVTDNTILTLLNYKSHSADELFSVLSSLSSYNLEGSKFFKQYPGDVKNVVYCVFSELSDYYVKNRENSLCERLCGKIYASSYTMFRSAVFYHRTERNSFVYEISDIHRYKCENESWHCERFFGYGGKNKQIGELLKAVDCGMRRKYDFKSTLNTGKTTKIVQDITDKEIGRYLRIKVEASLPRIEIDVSKLQNIRAAALETQEKLIVDEPEEELSQLSQGAGNSTNLGDAEYGFMCCLLYGRPYGDFIRSQGLMLSVLVDSINEKLFEAFSDTVIVYNGDVPELVADYIDELKGIIKK